MLRKHCNILILIVTTAIALVVASMLHACMPRLYNASTLVSDETQEMTIAVGMSSHLDKEPERRLDDPEVYQRMLDAPDFIEAICRIETDTVTGQCYGVHLNTQLDRATATPITLDDFRHFVKYAENRKARTIEVSVYDSDPLVAALIADSVVGHLQTLIRDRMVVALETNERTLADACAKAAADDEAARAAYSAYCDSHHDAVAPHVLSEIDRLKHESEMAHNELCTLTEQHLRARFLLQQSAPSFTVVRRATVPLRPLLPQPLAVYGAALVIGLVVGWWLCLLLRRLRRRDWALDLGGLFAPWTLTLVVWAAILCLVYLQGNRLYPLTSQFYRAISLWVPILCCVAFVMYHLLPSRQPLKLGGNNEVFASLHVNMRLFNALFVLVLVMTPLYAWNVYQVVSQFSTTDMLNNVRTLAVHGEGQGILKFTIVFNQVLFLVGIWAHPQVRTWKLVAIYVANVLCALALMEKGTFFLLILCTLFMLAERRVIRFRTMAIVGTASVLLLFLFNTVRETTEARASEMDFFEFVSTYVTSPPVAFCTLKEDLSQQWGANTFEVFYDYLNRFGVGNFIVNSKEQAFVQVPVVTNVYTVMQPFFVDFGYAGVAFFAAVYGVLAGCLYRGYRNGNSTARVLYTLLIQILVLQFYQENIFLSISGLMQSVILIVLLTQNTITVSSRPSLSHV